MLFRVFFLHELVELCLDVRLERVGDVGKVDQPFIELELLSYLIVL